MELIGTGAQVYILSNVRLIENHELEYASKECGLTGDKITKIGPV
jgi:hypothetical protein